MKRVNYLYVAALFFAFFTLNAGAQDCPEYHKKGDCTMDKQRGWKMYSQSKSSGISINESVEFNVVFYGQKNYVMSFCSSSHLYPVHFRLLDPETRDVLYDNSNDRHVGSLEVGFDVTRTLLIEINVLAQTASTDKQKSEQGCIGLLIQYDNY